MTERYLNIIEEAIKWIKNTSAMNGAKGETAYRNFVNYRRRLKKKKYALEDNPAAALYGESQVGKSYLASSLLSKSGSPFNVVDGRGNSFDFINQINPEGKGTESTSLVTRFSTGYKLINPDFPVKAKLLSIADIILVLCDTYYNDVRAKMDTALKSEEIKEKVSEVIRDSSEEGAVQSLLTEDDIFDIQDYFNSNFSTKASNVIHSDFFNQVSPHISRIEVKRWNELFGLLWNNNQHFDDLFLNLLGYYKILGFATEVYLPIDAVLREKGSLLEVTRLYEIYGTEEQSMAQFESNVSVLYNPESNEIAQDFSKSYLCALAAELVFRLPDNLEQEKPFLEETDLLDFPGARHRMEIHEEDIDRKIIPQLLLRGKVAYLFNKYSLYQKINILLFCQHNEDTKQGSVPELINNWIGDVVGKRPEEREDFIAKSKIPPLFVISTKFNIDLEYDPRNDKKEDQNALKERWKRRFDKALQKGVLSTETYNWFENWTLSSSKFQNLYLLRDFFYSSEGQSGVYRGYLTDKVEREEIVPEGYADLREDLKQSFLANSFVKNHFEDPELAWNSSTSINQDGSELIINKLTIASENINEAIKDKFNRELDEIGFGILKELKKYYHDSNSDKKIAKAKFEAGMIQFELDLAFGKDHFFFGPMMQEFMLNESEVYSLYQEKLKAIENLQIVNMGKYNGIRTNVPELDPNADFETNLKRLQKHYERSSLEDCEEYFEDQGIDLQELFYGNNERVKQFSRVLAESLEEYWFENHLQKATRNLIDAFSETGLQSTQDMLKVLYKKLEISEKVAKRIRTYVDGNTRIEESYGMIADLSAEIINKFINTVGIEYYTESDLADLGVANEKNNLGLVLDHSELDFEENTPEEAARLTSNMDKLDQLLNQNPLPADARRLPNYQSYIRWYDRLKVGFVSVCDIPNYDVQANNKLEKIIKSCEVA
jgi:hypothetical protein